MVFAAVVCILSCIWVIEACSPPPPPPRPHAFQCDNQYGTWDPRPWTYKVPVGDFCSSRALLPGKPDCARNARRNAPRISINDGEGTECMIEMFNSPDDQQNVYCLNSIINDNQKSETWLVFLVHGFMGSLDDGPYFDLLRESFLTRYGTSDRRIIGATVGYGAVSSKSQTKDLLETSLCILSSVFGDILGSNYVRASTTSMVMGHLLARLAETIKLSIPGTLKTFCIGISLGGQLCGFAGKDYRISGSPAMEGIIAIDPAGPIFESNSEDTRLDKSDAKAVQVFHTNSKGWGRLGYDPLCGSVDFYFNGAMDQPGCGGDGSCAHVYGFGFLLVLNNRNNATTGVGYRCLSTSGLIVGDLEHLSDSPSSAREELITFGEDAAEPYGCRDHVDL